MRNRLSRIIKPETERTVMLAVDHGYFMGPTHRLEQPGKTIEPLLSYADAIMCTRGVLRTSIDPKNNVPIVLRVSGGASVIGESLTNEAITTSIRDAVRLNVAAVALSIFVGSQHEHQTLTNLGHLVNLGEEYGVPVLAVTAVGKELEKRDARS
jgi:putative autoinducer-2 (AI-2) aldolase